MGSTNQKQKKLGLALGSGGVKGLVHVGFIKALLQNGIKIDRLAGSSIGAFVGAHFALFQDIRLLEELMSFNKRDKLSFLWDPILHGGLVDGQKLENYISSSLDDAEFSDLKIPFKAVATDLVRGERIIISKGKLAPAVRASMSIPSIFRPVVRDDMVLVDGGVANPVPDDIVKSMGAEIVVSINLDNSKHDHKFKTTNLKLTGIVMRSIDIMQHHLAEHSIRSSDIIVSPLLSIGGFEGWTQYFTKEIEKELVKAGEQEAYKIMAELKHLLKKEIFWSKITHLFSRFKS
jgi:NTE family protein